jgi:hypothetical protein
MKYLKIGGHQVELKIEDLGEDDNGKFDWDTNTITISSRLPKSQRESALIHEILHGCNSTWSETELGHIFLDSLSEQLYQIFSDNNLFV